MTETKTETKTETTYSETVSKISGLSNAELDQELEDAAIMNEQSIMLLCCYLAAVRERGAFYDFGYSSIYDYTEARFGFSPRKTRYLVVLGHKIEDLPKIREALMTGKIGWCKASRIAAVATPADEAMWLDSAVSLSVRQLERRIKDGTDSLASELRLPLTEDQRVLWENALEIYRRRAGAEISPVEAFEYMVAEVVAEWSHLTNPETADASEEPETAETEPAAAEDDTGSESTERDAPEPDAETREARVFPWTQPIDPEATTHWENERAAERDFAMNPDYNAVRNWVLERDGWKCTYPGCHARAQLHVHHIRFRSRGGCDEPWNLTVVCKFHHDLIHSGQVGVRGGAPMALEWIPPTLMREVLERRRNQRSLWTDELEIREWSLEHRAATA